MSSRKLANQGGGLPPFYLWNLICLEQALAEAAKLLNVDQYQHIKFLIQQLLRERDPTHSQTQSIDAVDDYHELRDKGGILGKLNLRVFFFLDKPTSDLVILGLIDKRNDGPTRKGDRLRIARRKRLYLEGKNSGP